MNDLFFFGALLLTFFVLWVYAGGPNNPISFAGPYITPITDAGVQSVGYDDGTKVSHSFWGTVSGSSATSNNTQIIDSARSPFEGKVRISASNPEATDPRSEFITIRSESNSDVTITGWQLIRASNGVQEKIPEGGRRSSSKEVIVLSPGEKALIISGTRASAELKGTDSDVWRAYLGSRSEIWSSGNDTITLVDSNGKVVDQYRY